MVSSGLKTQNFIKMNLQNEAIELQRVFHQDYKTYWEETEAIKAHLESRFKALGLLDISNRFDAKYTPPFRVGRKQGKAVLDANGREVIFFKDSEEQAKKYCDYLNGG